MPSIPKIRRRGQKQQMAVDRPLSVTANFELHYEEVVRNNKFAIIAFLATGLVAVASFIPTAVYQSVAGTETVTIETEDANLTNGAKVESDPKATGGLYILLKSNKDN